MQNCPGKLSYKINSPAHLIFIDSIKVINFNAKLKMGKGRVSLKKA